MDVNNNQHPSIQMDSSTDKSGQMSPSGQMKQASAGLQNVGMAEGPANAAITDLLAEEQATIRTSRFWAILISLGITGFASAVEGTIITSALPTITQDLGGGDG